jgi:hypothetical protein
MPSCRFCQTNKDAMNYSSEIHKDFHAFETDNYHFIWEERRGGGTCKKLLEVTNFKCKVSSFKCKVPSFVVAKKFNILVKVTLLEVALKLCFWFLFAMNSFTCVKKIQKKLCNLWKIKFKIITTGKN